MHQYFKSYLFFLQHADNIKNYGDCSRQGCQRPHQPRWKVSTPPEPWADTTDSCRRHANCRRDRLTGRPCLERTALAVCIYFLVRRHQIRCCLTPSSTTASVCRFLTSSFLLLPWRFAVVAPFLLARRRTRQYTWTRSGSHFGADCCHNSCPIAGCDFAWRHSSCRRTTNARRICVEA